MAEQDTTLKQLYTFMCLLVFATMIFPPVYSLEDGYLGFKFILTLTSSELVETGRLLLLYAAMGLWTLTLRTIFYSTPYVIEKEVSE